MLLAHTVTSVYAPQLLRGFIDGVVAGHAAAVLARVAALFLAVAAGRQITRGLTAYFSESVAWSATNRLRTDLLRHSVGLDLSFVNRHPPGVMLERIDGDSNQLATFLFPALAAPAARHSAAGGDRDRAAARRLAAVPGAAGVRGAGDLHPGEAAQLRRALSRTAARGGGQPARFRRGASGRHRRSQGARRLGARHAPDGVADCRPGTPCQAGRKSGRPGVAGGERGDGDRHRSDARLGRHAVPVRRRRRRSPPAGCVRPGSSTPSRRCSRAVPGW